MNLAVVNEAVTEMNGVEHQFTEEDIHEKADLKRWRFTGVTV